MMIVQSIIAAIMVVIGIIVLAGKGHEDYQILKGMKKIHFDEREVVAEALLEINN